MKKNNTNIFESPNKFLKYAMLFCTTIILLGLLFAIFFGFNTSYEFGGYYEINIDYQNISDTNDYIEGTKEVLKEYGYNINESATVGDKSYLYNLCIRYKSDSDINASKIEADIESKFGLGEEFVSVDKISNTYALSTILSLIWPAVILILLLMLYGWLRRNLFYALSMGSIVLSSILLQLSVISITRIKLSVATIGIMTITTIVATVVFTYYTSQMFERKNSHEGEKEDYPTLFSTVISESLFTVQIPALVGLAVFIGLILTFNTTLIGVGLSGIVCLLVATFASIFIGGNVYLAALTSESGKIKSVMSRNKNKSEQEKVEKKSRKKSN